MDRCRNWQESEYQKRNRGFRISNKVICSILEVPWQNASNCIWTSRQAKVGKFLTKKSHTVREWIYNRHKLPRTFDSSLSIYDINAYKKCLEKLIWTKKKNHVPQGGIEPAPFLVRSGLARIKWKMSSALPTELLGHLYNSAQK